MVSYRYSQIFPPKPNQLGRAPGRPDLGPQVSDSSAGHLRPKGQPGWSTTMGDPQNAWFRMENLIKMDSLFRGSPILGNLQIQEKKWLGKLSSYWDDYKEWIGYDSLMALAHWSLHIFRQLHTISVYGDNNFLGERTIWKRITTVCFNRKNQLTTQ